MNELALVFDRMEIDSQDVMDAMNTKWNALGFAPGLVGGHCIGVDPYYFVYEAENLGYHSQIVLNGRQINDGMGEFIADRIIKELILANKRPAQAKVAILGLTFKEHTPDVRNSRVVDIVDRLREYDIEPAIVDPWAQVEEVRETYQLELQSLDQIQDADCVVFAVAHDEFKALNLEDIDGLFRQDLPKEQRILIDVKSILDKESLKEQGYIFWRL